MSVIISSNAETMICGDSYKECYEAAIKFLKQNHYKICVLTRQARSKYSVKNEEFLDPIEYIFNTDPTFKYLYEDKCNEQYLEDCRNVADIKKDDNIKIQNRDLIVKQVDEITDDLLADWCDRLAVTIDNIDTIESLGARREIYAICQSSVISKFIIYKAWIYKDNEDCDVDDQKVGIVLKENRLY